MTCTHCGMIVALIVMDTQEISRAGLCMLRAGAPGRHHVDKLQLFLSRLYTHAGAGNLGDVTGADHEATFVSATLQAMPRQGCLAGA